MEPLKRKKVEPLKVEDLTQIIHFESAEVISSLNLLKKKLTTKEKVLEFIDRERGNFQALIVLFRKIADEIFTSSQIAPTRTTTFRDLISLLANICYFSLTACHEIQTNVNFANYSLRIIEAGERMPEMVKIAILRLLGNFSEYRENAPLFISHPALLDKIALTINSEDQMAEQALRIIRLLSRRTQTAKAVISSNSCYNIGMFIAELSLEELQKRTDILQTLFNLVRRGYPHHVGRQLASSSECVELFLKLLFMDEDSERQNCWSQWKEFILECTKQSSDLRGDFGRRNVIDRVLSLEQGDLTKHYCRLLCCFTNEAWSRKQLRESGALKRILDFLAQPLSLQLQEHEEILSSFRHFFYDIDSMICISQHPGFISSAILHIRNFLSQNSVQCQIEYPSAEETLIYSPTSPPWASHDTKTEEDNLESSFIPIPDVGTPSSSYSRRLSRKRQEPLTSPSMSPTWGGPSPSPNGSSPPYGSTSPASSDSFLEDFFWMDDQQRDVMSPDLSESIDRSLEIEEHVPDTVNVEKKMVEEVEAKEREDCNKEAAKLESRISAKYLQVISLFSHLDERYNICLTKQEILTVLINHISDAPELHNKLSRFLKRLARNGMCLQALIEMEFQLMIVNKLVRRDCILARFSKPCPRCELRRDFGRELLTDFAACADSAIGWYHVHTQLMKHVCESDFRIGDSTRPSEMEVRPVSAEYIHALCSGILLIRKKDHRPNFYEKIRPVHRLVDALGALIAESAREGCPLALSEANNRGELCWDIITGLSSLLCQRRLDQLPDLNLNSSTATTSTKLPALFANKTRNRGCLLEDVDLNAVSTLKFYNKVGEQIAAVPKEQLCASSGYFLGMFESEFVENIESRQNFVFDEEQDMCSEEDFVKFLHFSIGCRPDNQCVHFESAETFASLLYLSDKYLLNFLKDGECSRARRLINGDTLHVFLPLCLSTPQLAEHLLNNCMLVLLRYSNARQLLRTFSEFAANPQAIDALKQMLLNFVELFTNSTPQFDPNSVVRYWDF